MALLLIAALSAPRQAEAAADSAALRREAFALAYNLDHDQALARLRQAVTDNPSDAAAHRALASMLWLHMLFVRGAVTVDHYLGSFSRTQVELSKPRSNWMRNSAGTSRAPSNCPRPGRVSRRAMRRPITTSAPPSA